MNPLPLFPTSIIGSMPRPPHVQELIAVDIADLAGSGKAGINKSWRHHRSFVSEIAVAIIDQKAIFDRVVVVEKVDVIDTVAGQISDPHRTRIGLGPPGRK